jgi:hypothetical protein
MAPPRVNWRWWDRQNYIDETSPLLPFYEPLPSSTTNNSTQRIAEYNHFNESIESKFLSDDSETDPITEWQVLEPDSPNPPPTAASVITPRRISHPYPRFPAPSANQEGVRQYLASAIDQMYGIPGSHAVDIAGRWHGDGRKLRRHSAKKWKLDFGEEMGARLYGLVAAEVALERAIRSREKAEDLDDEECLCKCSHYLLRDVQCHLLLITKTLIRLRTRLASNMVPHHLRISAGFGGIMDPHHEVVGYAAVRFACNVG